MACHYLVRNTRDQEGGSFILAIGGGPGGYLQRINPGCADVRIHQGRKIMVSIGQQFSIFLGILEMVTFGARKKKYSISSARNIFAMFTLLSVFNSFNAMLY